MLFLLMEKQSKGGAETEGDMQTEKDRDTKKEAKDTGTLTHLGSQGMG